MVFGRPDVVDVWGLGAPSQGNQFKQSEGRSPPPFVTVSLAPGEPRILKYTTPGLPPTHFCAILCNAHDHPDYARHTPLGRVVQPHRETPAGNVGQLVGEVQA